MNERTNECIGMREWICTEFVMYLLCYIIPDTTVCLETPIDYAWIYHMNMGS